MIQVVQGETSPDFIDFGVGHPADDLLPLEIMQRVAVRRLQSGDPTLLQYGYEQGDGYFRLALAEFLSRHYAMTVDAESLFVTNGVSQALDLICTLYTRPGDVIFVEEPSYFLALRIFADHGLRVVSLPTDENGLIMEALEEALFRQPPAFLYLIPTHQNPSGATLSLERRHQLAQLCQEYDLFVIADEVYHLLSYGEPPPPPLAALAAGGAVLSLGSFSKILAPGLRLGWVQAAPGRIHRLTTSGLLDSGGGLNPFTSGLTRLALEEGWQDEYLARLRQVYSQRATSLDRSLQAQLGDLVVYRTPGGGYFFWLRLPEEIDAERLLTQAVSYKVSFRPGVRFSSRGGLRNYLRLSFAFYDIPELEKGVARLTALLDGERYGKRS